MTTVPISLFFLQGQAGYLRERGFDVRACSSPGELLERFADQEQIPVYAVEMSRRISPLSDLAAIFKLCRLLRQIRPQIVRAYTPKAGLLGMLAAWLVRIPVRIYHIYGLRYITASSLMRHLLWWNEKITCCLAHRVLCISHSIREVALQDALCSADKASTLLNGSGNGVDAVGRFNPANVPEHVCRNTRARYGIPANALVIGFVGRIVRDKGLIELVEAWKLLREEFTRLHLLVVGAFEPEDPVPPEVEELLRHDPRVHLTGWVEGMPALYASIDILVLPTYREGFPYSLLEAASMCLPVVATRIPGCVDAVEDNSTGLLVPPRDLAALADAVRTYLSDQALRHKHGQAGRQRVLRDFRPEDIWKALHEEYLRLLQERALPIPVSVSKSEENVLRTT